MFEQPNESSGSRKPLVIGLVVGAVAVAVFLGAIFYQSYRQKKIVEDRRELEKSAKELAALRDMRDISYGEPYLKGKVAIFNRDENKLDVAHEGIPADVRASSKEEMTTLVTVSCRQELEGFYFEQEGLRSAHGRNCNLYVVDLAARAIVGRKEIYGYAPHFREKNTDPTDAVHPDDQIIAYVKSLPRK